MSDHVLNLQGYDADLCVWDYEITHALDCPIIEWYYGADYGCAVAMFLSDAGEEGFHGELDELEPGRYWLQYRSIIHETRWGREYDAELVIGEKI